MPPGFALPTDFTEDAAEPTQSRSAGADEDDLTQFGNHGDYGAARLAPGATRGGAPTEELRAATRQLTAEGKYDPTHAHGAFAVVAAGRDPRPAPAGGRRRPRRRRSCCC